MMYLVVNPNGVLNPKQSIFILWEKKLRECHSKNGRYGLTKEE